MFNRVITLFNYREQDNLWRTVLFKGVNVADMSASTASVQGTNNNGSIEIILLSDRKQKVGKLQYVPPKAYQALEDVTGYFTLTPDVDFIALGDNMSSVPISEDDYDEGFYHAMNDAYDGVYKIVAASWFSLLPHFEIDGR